MDRIKAEILVGEKRLAVNKNKRLHNCVRNKTNAYYKGLIDGLKGPDHVAHCVERVESELAKSLDTSNATDEARRRTGD